MGTGVGGFGGGGNGALRLPDTRFGVGWYEFVLSFKKQALVLRS